MTFEHCATHTPVGVAQNDKTDSTDVAAQVSFAAARHELHAAALNRTVGQRQS